MSKILQDIQTIMRLAADVKRQLETGNINEARKELDIIVRLDADELAELQKSHGDIHLLQHCMAVLNAAKRALMLLKQEGINAEALELIDKIIEIENSQVLQKKCRGRVAEWIIQVMDKIKGLKSLPRDIKHLRASD